MKLYDSSGNEIFINKHILKTLINYFFTNDENMSNRHKVHSGKFLMERYGDSPNRCSDKVRESLTELLEPFFDTVSVTTSFNDKPNYTISIDINVTRNNSTVNLQESLIRRGDEPIQNKIYELKQYI